MYETYISVNGRDCTLTCPSLHDVNAIFIAFVHSFGHDPSKRAEHSLTRRVARNDFSAMRDNFSNDFWPLTTIYGNKKKHYKEIVNQTLFSYKQCTERSTESFRNMELNTGNFPARSGFPLTEPVSH